MGATRDIPVFSSALTALAELRIEPDQGVVGQGRIIMPLRVSVEDTKLCADSDQIRQEMAIGYVLSGPKIEDVCKMFDVDQEHADFCFRQNLNPFPDWFYVAAEEAAHIRQSRLIVPIGPSTYLLFD